MQEIFVEEIAKVVNNKRKLETTLEVKITNKGKLVFVNGVAEKEYIALKVLDAINLGFNVPQALILSKDETELHTLNIKDITKRNDLERVRARIIGTKGKALSTIKNLTNCDISLKENKIGIIGDCEEIENATQAITSLIQGSKHGNVYAHTEKQKKHKRLERKGSQIRNELE